MQLHMYFQKQSIGIVQDIFLQIGIIHSKEMS